MRTVLYLTSESRLQPGDTYARNGVTPIVILKGNGTNLYTEGWKWPASAGPIAAQIRGPWHAGLWAQGPRGETLAPWADEVAWATVLGNLKRLAGILPPTSGIVFDGEIYSATPGNSGGLMDSSAWTAGEKAELRGWQVRQALGNRLLGQYVLVSDAKRHAGWEQFWKGAYKPGDLLLDESGYLGARRAKAFARIVRNLPGRKIEGGKFVGRVPPGDFFLYPWSGEDRPGVLEGVSAKWKT